MSQPTPNSDSATQNSLPNSTEESEPTPSDFLSELTILFAGSISLTAFYYIASAPLLDEVATEPGLESTVVLAVGYFALTLCVFLNLLMGVCLLHAFYANHKDGDDR